MERAHSEHEVPRLGSGRFNLALGPISTFQNKEVRKSRKLLRSLSVQHLRRA